MKLVFFVSLLFLFGCTQKKDIQFEVGYSIDKEYLEINENEILIHDFPLRFQANVEKNYSKKSQIDTIQLIAITSNIPLLADNFELLDNNSWMSIREKVFLQKNNVDDFEFKYQLLNKNENWYPIFKERDKLSMRIKADNHIDSNSILIKLIFSMKGKLDKTNVIYRIIG